VGPATFRTLVNEFGGAAAAIAALPLLSRRGGRSDIRLCTEAEAEAELALAESLGASLVAIGEPGYPPALAQVDSPPPLLYVKGRLELADIPMIAIVGARNGSAVGQKFTRALATDLALEGFVIASGLARGIDTAAHMAALDHGTVAVLAGGIDNIYPPENEELHSAIGERGLLISERSPGFAARTGLPPPQPLDLGHLARRGGGRSGRAVGLADHRASRRRAGARGLRRARQSPRFAFRRYQQSLEARRVPRHFRP
jgi:DNA processing protein